MSELTISQTHFDAGSTGQHSLPGMLVVTSGPDKEQSIIVEGPVISIGTLADNSFILSDKTVSRHHARLVQHGGQYFIHDLGSTNGILVNGKKVSEARLEMGSVIKLGYTQLSYQPYERRRALAASWHGIERRRPASRSGAASRSSGPSVYWGGISGCSAQMKSLFKMLDRIAPTDATIIIEGETGTGKELLARAIHEKSQRSGSPFIVYDCRAISGTQLENELLGYEKGAFPGAARLRPGVFEQACGGTLFLDEICELDPELQPKLLRVLENREVRRMGAEESIRVDARIIASTGCDLDAQVAANRFRKDLFYRLAVHRIVIPPLRERPDDIALIAADLLQKLAPEYNISAAPRIACETIEIFKAHGWSGNVRELRNVLSRALGLGCRSVLRPENLLVQADEEYGLHADISFENIEKIAIEQALLRRNGDLVKSAKELGLPHHTFIDKIQKYDLT